MARIPESLKNDLDQQQLKLYTLIWERTIASQMAEAQLKRVGADITARQYTFRATGQTILFDGYLRVYLEGRDEPEVNHRAEEDEEGTGTLPPLKMGESLTCRALVPEQHFTKPPPRYTEASLVKKLEEEGIGRPSTYAPTISVIQQRGYIKKEGHSLLPEEIAFTVTDLLTEHFPDIVDLAFTAKMEESLDSIAEDKLRSLTFLRGFYGPFHELVQSKTQEIQKGEVLKDRELGVDPETGLPVLARTGRFGPYIQLGRVELKPGERLKNLPKPKCASIPKSLSKDTITLKQALALLAFPRVLGEKDGQTIEVHLGRFGPYIKWGKGTATLPKEANPSSVAMDEALAFLATVKQHRAQAAQPLRTIGNDPITGAAIEVKTGRFGPYVTDGKTNASLGKKRTVEEITLEEASDLLAKKRARGPGKWRGRRWGRRQS
jgi:DNA topoisomerase-1